MPLRKVAELEGALLDAAVAKALGARQERQFALDILVFGDDCPFTWPTTTVAAFKPSSDWAFGGPIIERERITTIPEKNHPPDRWYARLGGTGVFGTTALIAAMRAYVASKFGEEVELP